MWLKSDVFIKACSDNLNVTNTVDISYLLILASVTHLAQYLSRAQYAEYSKEPSVKQSIIKHLHYFHFVCDVCLTDA